MNADKTFETVCRLLQMYDRIVVAHAVHDGKYGGCIDLFHAPADSLLRVYQQAVAANVGFDIRVKGLPFKLGHHADPANLQYRIIFSAGVENDNSLQRFGCFVAWDLASLGILERGEAKQMLRDWHARFWKDKEP